MSKWSEEFCEKYGDTKNLKRLTREMKYGKYKKKSFNEKMKEADQNITKITKGKLGKTA